MTSFYGYYLEFEDNSGSFYPYENGEISWESMDEFNCAFLDLSDDESHGEFTFLDEGISGDISWTITDDGRIEITMLYTGDVYYGDFFRDMTFDTLYVCIYIDDYRVWMIQGEKINR